MPQRSRAAVHQGRPQVQVEGKALTHRSPGRRFLALVSVIRADSSFTDLTRSDGAESEAPGGRGTFRVTDTTPECVLRILISFVHRTQLWTARAEVGAEAMGGVRLSTHRAGVASGQKVASDDPDNRVFILCDYNGSADANRQIQTRTQTSRTQNATRSTLNSGQWIKCYGWERPPSCRPWRYAVKTRSRRSCIR